MKANQQRALSSRAVPHTLDFIMRLVLASSNIHNFKERCGLIKPPNKITDCGYLQSDSTTVVSLSESLHIKVDLGHYLRLGDCGQIRCHIILQGFPELLGCIASTLFSQLQKLVLEYDPFAI
jgi:hypothetical protein